MNTKRKLSLLVVSGLITLSGCADKEEVVAVPETTNEDSSPAEEVAIVDQKNVVEEPSVTEEVPVVVEENPPKFAEVTDYIALKPNTVWQWETLAKIPNVQEWNNKRPARNEYLPEDPSYSISGGLSEHGGLSVYGTETQPMLITIGSGQGVMEDETGSGVYKLEDLFRASELTRIKSNCDTEEDSLFSQQFYKWQKPGYQPLYIYSIIDQANAGTSSDVGIAKSFDEFFNPDYKNALMHLSSYDADSNAVTCTFDL